MKSFKQYINESRVEQGDSVEIINPKHKFYGKEGYVSSVAGNKATMTLYGTVDEPLNGVFTVAITSLKVTKRPK